MWGWGMGKHKQFQIPCALALLLAGVTCPYSASAGAGAQVGIGSPSNVNTQLPLSMHVVPQRVRATQGAAGGRTTTNLGLKQSMWVVGKKPSKTTPTDMTV